jgi:hypothetical protein
MRFTVHAHSAYQPQPSYLTFHCMPRLFVPRISLVRIFLQFDPNEQWMGVFGSPLDALFWGK